MSAAKISCYKCGTSGHIASQCTAAAIQEEQQPASQAQTVLLPGDSSFTEVYGDLMNSKDSLCHCVSECLAMGKGIAVLFKQRFGGVDELKAQKIGVGGVAVLDRRDTDGRYVYYLITKPRYFHKPTYQTLASSLAAMFQHMAANGVRRVAMPEIGCGLDGLEWGKVKEMLLTMVTGSGLQVTVYHFKPARQMRGRDGDVFV